MFPLFGHAPPLSPPVTLSPSPSLSFTRSPPLLLLTNLLLLLILKHSRKNPKALSKEILERKIEKEEAFKEVKAQLL